MRHASLFDGDAADLEAALEEEESDDDDDDDVFVPENEDQRPSPFQSLFMSPDRLRSSA